MKIPYLNIPFTWPYRHPVILRNFFYLPGCFEAHQDWGPLPWSHTYLFRKSLPLAVEYCSGNGQWICEKAQQNPHLNWIAVEKYFPRARKIWLRLYREEIDNLFVVCGEAHVFTHYYFSPENLTEVYINFPDPWPKRRHARHRLVQKPFIHLLAKQVRQGGKMHCVTDDKTYVMQMLREIESVSAWHSLLPAPYFTTNVVGYGNSFFEGLWREKGRDIYHLSFQRKS